MLNGSPTYSRVARLRDWNQSSFTGGNLFAKWDSGTGKFVGAPALSPTGDGGGLTNLTAANIAAGTAAINISGNAAGLSATLAINKGGTGQTTATAAINALLPAQASAAGKVLTSDGSAATWEPTQCLVSAADATTLLSTHLAGGDAGNVLTVDPAGNLGQTAFIVVDAGDATIAVSAEATFTAPVVFGTGGIRVEGVHTATNTFNAVDFAAAYGNDFIVPLLAGSNSIDWTGDVAGQAWRITLRQPSTGAAGTATWPATVRWPGGQAPTLTATNGAEDVVIIERRPDISVGVLDYRGTLVGLDY